MPVFLAACTCPMFPHLIRYPFHILQQGILCHRQVENTFQVPGDEESADKSQFDVDTSGM